MCMIYQFPGVTEYLSSYPWWTQSPVCPFFPFLSVANYVTVSKLRTTQKIIKPAQL